jgi:hypothetical protein
MVRSGVHHAEADLQRSSPGAVPGSMPGEAESTEGVTVRKEIGLTSGRSALRSSRYRKGRYHL